MKCKLNQQLEPCPFCGGTVKKWTAPLKKTQMFVCGKCDAEGPRCRQAYRINPIDRVTYCWVCGQVLDWSDEE